MDSSGETNYHQYTTRSTSQSKNRAIKKKKRISRIKPKETLKVPSRRVESRIEKRKVARLIGGPVVRQRGRVLSGPKHTIWWLFMGSVLFQEPKRHLFVVGSLDKHIIAYSE